MRGGTGADQPLTSVKGKGQITRSSPLPPGTGLGVQPLHHAKGLSGLLLRNRSTHQGLFRVQMDQQGLDRLARSVREQLLDGDGAAPALYGGDAVPDPVQAAAAVPGRAVPASGRSALGSASTSGLCSRSARNC